MITQIGKNGQLFFIYKLWRSFYCILRSDGSCQFKKFPKKFKAVYRGIFLSTIHKNIAYSMSNNKRAVLLLLGLLLQLNKMIKLRRLIKDQDKILLTLKEIDLLSVPELKNKLMQGIHKIGDLVLCRGRLTSAQPSFSILQPKRSVAYSELIMDKIWTMGIYEFGFEKILRKKHPDQLILSSKRDAINIYQTYGTKIIAPYWKVHPLSQKKTSTLKQLLSIIFWLPYNTYSSITELYIPNKMDNVVFGKVSKSANGQPSMQKPLFIAPTKKIIIQELVSKIKMNRIMFYGLAFFSLLTLVFLLKSLFKILKDLGFFKNKSFNLIDRLEKIKVKDRSCAICKQKVSSQIRIPCLHLNICGQCEQKVPLEKKRCQSCNRKIKDTIQIYAI